MKLKEKKHTNTYFKPSSQSVKKSRYNGINITCAKLKNDLKWFTSLEGNSSFAKNEPLFCEEKTIGALVENWWVNS
jgi:hypothetical protein